ncbi:MAG: GHKL domain-containing protein [Ruminococcus sp.]
MKKVSNIIAFIAIPLLTMAIIYITVYILILTDYRSDLILLLSIICISMIVVAAMVWFMIARINRDNQISIKLLLSEQRADLYEKNIMNSNREIENTAKIRHDMKNSVACIDTLIMKGKYDEAHKICQEMTDKFSVVGSIVNTDNLLLNAVLNVELEKARLNGISVKLNISDDMRIFRNGSDIISIIGNLLDNAISYLSCQNIENKKMYFSIENTGFYTVLKCENKIKKSVLSENPLLLTNKNDKHNHGKGISIIKSIAEKYGGDTIITEKDDEFIVSVILDNRNLPENL